jgi:1-acyl-sn-glycerol-3-phosphate acyltransferase
VVGLFPYGRIHLPDDHSAKMKPGALLLARRSGAPLVPVRIGGVRGAGRIVGAVFVRSRVSLHTHALLDPGHLSSEQLRTTLEALLGPAANHSATDAVI